jgi:hypothetical protein
MVLVPTDCSEHFANLELAQFTETGVGAFLEVAVVAEECSEAGDDPRPDAHEDEGFDSVGPRDHGDGFGAVELGTEAAEGTVTIDGVTGDGYETDHRSCAVVTAGIHDQRLAEEWKIDGDDVCFVDILSDPI